MIGKENQKKKKSTQVRFGTCVLLDKVEKTSITPALASVFHDPRTIIIIID